MMEIQTSLSKRTQIVVLFLMVAIIFIPRSLNLVDYVTADEPLYLKQSANFYFLLNEGRFDETDLIVHPGVPSLWSGALGFYVMFPQYLEDERTDYPIADLNFRKVLEDGGTNSRFMLGVGRAISIGLQTVILVLAFYFGQRIFGFWPSLMITLVVSFDPFYFANSRILQPDGMLAAAMYLALVACLSYLHTRSNFSLLVSGASSGLAILSKVPGIVLLPLVAGLFVAFWWWRQPSHHRTSKDLVLLLRAYLAWLVVAILVIFILWPVMWVQPVGAISGLATFATEASGEVNSPMFFNGNLIPEGEFGPEYSYYYPLSFLWRTTPIVLLGLFLGVCSIFLKSARQNFWKEKGFSALAFLCAALLIVFFFTLSAKKADRYILPAMVYLDVVAALGYFAFISYFPWKIKSPKKTGVILTMLVVVILQIGMVVQAYPYFHSYYNPMLGGLEKAQKVMQVGWGEGLNEAAEYLNQVPMKTRYLRVITWYSAAFDYHFVAVSDEIPISGPVDDALMGDFFEADYLVIYLSQRQRNSAHRLLDFLEDKTPEHIVKIRGVEYVWVYNMGEIIEQMDRENE